MKHKDRPAGKRRYLKQYLRKLCALQRVAFNKHHWLVRRHLGLRPVSTFYYAEDGGRG